MMRIGGTGRGPGKEWSVAGITTALVLVALLPIAVLHTIGAAVVDPLTSTISDYVGVPGGFALLVLSCAALAVSCTVIAGALGPAGLPRAAGPTKLLISGAAALIVVGLFPTNYPGEPIGIVANVHRVAGAWIFVALPLAGWLVARRAHESDAWRAGAPMLSWVAGGTGVLSGVFILSHAPIVFSGSPIISLHGALERVLYAAVMLTLLATARATRLALSGARVPAAAVRSLNLPTTELGRAA